MALVATGFAATLVPHSATSIAMPGIAYRPLHHPTMARVDLCCIYREDDDSPILQSLLASMRRGSVLVDIAIDQGGCFESSRPTTHAAPTFIEEGIVHYCVTNMPGAVPRTSTLALTNATLPFVKELADLGLAATVKCNPHMLRGLNVHAGALCCEPVARALDLPLTDWRDSSTGPVRAAG